MDSFDFNDVNYSLSKMRDAINKINLIYVIIGIFVWVFAYFNYTFLLIFSDRIVRKIKIAYLKSILS
jgi:hypothetical protein